LLVDKQPSIQKAQSVKPEEIKEEEQKEEGEGEGPRTIQRTDIIEFTEENVTNIS
jgi:hypothetical protein